ncbi:MAG: DNA polymerase III subunit epsilon [Piscinibacter sp.]|nr:DNA polymerase III subunit epsilon [Piscinibacter sp.]
MKVDRREWFAALLPGALLALWALGGGLLFAATLEPAERAALGAMLEPRVALLLLGWLLLSGALGALARQAYLRWVAGAARLAEEAQVLLATDVQRELAPQGCAETRALAGVINQFAQQRDGLRADMAAQVKEASRGVEQERNRLAALMAELTQSVVVCNLDGRILLYNTRARTQFRALSHAPSVADGAELIGLGRSIYAVFDRALVAHALESVQQRLQRGAAHPSAQFVTGTRAGQLLRVQMAPVRAIAADGTAAPGGEAAGAEVALNGFVLMLENITRDFAAECERDRLLHGLTEGSRASLGNLQAAVEMLDYEDLDAPTRERFLGVVRDEVQTMSRRIRELASHTTQTMKTRWPLEDVLGADLLAAAARRIETLHGCRVGMHGVDAALWMKVDSFSLLQALVYLAGRLVEEYGLKSLQLRLAEAGGRARVDLVWTGQAMSTETVIGWETDPIRVGADTLALTVRDVVERHEGAFWFERERVRHESFFRLLLPLADAGEQLDAAMVVRSESRPEVYDFDLFRPTEQARSLADRWLAELAYTVFDTETTGLQPSEGDEIIQIGATRIVAGKLRREDCFEQLVDPQRGIPAASIPIHGITPEMVRGAPTIDVVLPAFHTFAQDTVLVAHNAAFDMRFLELKQARTGLVFDQPVLDTLLLSAVVHPQQASHRLEAIAERFGVPVLGRHTALGDAMVTAEVFMKLIPLLAERGIHTLGQARDAAQQTYYARVSY